MKILYIVSNASLNPLNNTGYARHIRATVNGLIELGHEVEVWHRAEGRIFLDKEPSKSVKKTEQVGLIKRVLKWALPGLIWETTKDLIYLSEEADFVNRIMNETELIEPDLVYERSSYLSSSGLRVSEKLSIPFALEVNSPFTEQREKLSGRSLLLGNGRVVESRNANKAQVVFTVSKALKDYLENSFNVDPQKVLSNANGVSPPESETIMIDKSSLFSDAESGPIVGFVGSIMPYHGVDILIDAFASALKSSPAIKLLVVGDGSQVSQLISRCRVLGIEESVKFTGSIPHDEVFSYIDTMDICIMPNSNWYGSPIKIFEYALKAKAVIAPDVGPVREVMEHGVDGLIVEPQIQSICESILALSEDIDLRQRLGITFQKKVLGSYTWAENTLRINREIGSF